MNKGEFMKMSNKIRDKVYAEKLVEISEMVDEGKLNSTGAKKLVIEITKKFYPEGIMNEKV